MTVRVPQEKLEKARRRLLTALEATRVSRLDMQRLLGTLNYLCQIMPAGRTFLFRLFEQLRHSPHKTSQPLPPGAQEDIQVWLRYLDQWNAEYTIQREQDITWADWGIYTDASDWGMGGYCQRLGQWFFVPWTPEQRTEHIGVRELWATLHALKTWGDHWCNATITLFTDNQSNVLMMTARRSRRDARAASILREIFATELTMRCRIKLVHVAGVDNGMADDLSLDRVDQFLIKWQL